MAAAAAEAAATAAAAAAAAAAVVAPVVAARGRRLSAATRSCRRRMRDGRCRRGYAGTPAAAAASLPPPPVAWRPPERSRTTAAAAPGRRASPPPSAVGHRRTTHGSGGAGFGPPPRLRGVWPGVGHARPCPPPPLVRAPASGCSPSTLHVCARGRGLWRPPRWSPAPQRRPPSPPRVAAAVGTRRPPRQPMGQVPPVGRTPIRPPHRGAARVRAGAAVAARRLRRARADAPPTAAQSGRGGAAGAGAERHVDARDARLTSRTTWVGTSEDGMGWESTPAAVAPLVRRPTNVVCAADEYGVRVIVRGFHGGCPVVWVRKGRKKEMEALLVWRDSGEV